MLNFNEKIVLPYCWIFIFLAVVCMDVQAQASISGLDDIAINAWAGTSGDLEGADTYCVQSYQRVCEWSGPPWNRTCTNEPRSYDVAAYTSGTSDGSGNFYLTHTNGSDTLMVVFEWSNPVVGTYQMYDMDTVYNTAPPSSPYAPGATSCTQPISQNTITIRILAADLATAIAGTYSETFAIDMCRLNQSESDYIYPCLAQVNFTVSLPELIQLTQLQDFDLGSWSGVGDVQATRDFCVFRNGYGGFSLTASGNNDTGSEFNVSDGSSNIPFAIDFSDGGSWFSAAPGGTLSGGTTGFTGDSTRNCGGGTTHSMRVTMQQADLAAAQAGSYSDTVTILVQPE